MSWWAELINKMPRSYNTKDMKEKEQLDYHVIDINWIH